MKEKNRKILILANSDKGLYNFRKELIDKLLNNQYLVYIVVPKGARTPELIEMGCHVIDISLERQGTNPLKDMNLFLKYKKILKEIKPEIVLTYTIKPNIYGGIACRLAKIPYIANITGLGSAIEDGGILSKILLKMYEIAFKKIKCVFCQNEANLKFLIESKIVKNDRLKLIPGSGVNLDKFQLKPYPDDDIIRFIFVGRIMKKKGIEQYLETAEYIKNKYSSVEFGIVGRYEEKYSEKIKQLQNKNIIKYYGEQADVKPFLEKASCIIHPTFYAEGMSNVLLEAAATGRPAITTNRPGCKEIVDDGKTGFLIKEQNTEDLIDKVERFIKLDMDKKKEMGIAARKKVEDKFNRNIVINRYMEEINN